jgi:hypothetical protein
VTCGFSASRPALSRRPRAVGAGTTRFLDGRELAQRRAAANLAASEDVQFVPVLTSLYDYAVSLAATAPMTELIASVAGLRGRRSG